MKINSTRFGTIEIPDDHVLTLQKGLLGFEDRTQWVMLDHDIEDSPFKWLQSQEDPDLAFIIIEPSNVVSDYQVEIPKDIMESLELTSLDEAVVFVLVTIPADPTKVTANLLGPVVVNVGKRKGLQLVLNNENYSVCHPLLADQTSGPSSPSTP